MTWIKICGITSPKDAEAAIKAGVSAIGLVFAASSPRRVTLEQARKIAALARDRVQLVGVFTEAGEVAAAHELVAFDLVQIHGDAPLDVAVPLMRAVRPEHLDQTAFDESEIALIDGSEGKGIAFNWARVRSRAGRFVIAGGLTPENVGNAIAAARPYGVDVSSGVESARGVKDPVKIDRFVEAVRRADGV